MIHKHMKKHYPVLVKVTTVLNILLLLPNLAFALYYLDFILANAGIHIFEGMVVFLYQVLAAIVFLSSWNMLYLVLSTLLLASLCSVAFIFAVVTTIPFQKRKNDKLYWFNFGLLPVIWMAVFSYVYLLHAYLNRT